MKRTLTVIEDAGHAWLKVPQDLWERVDANLTCLSPYSYATPSKQGGSYNGFTLYLEEDCDLPKFVEMAAAKGIEIKFRTYVVPNGDWIGRSRMMYQYTRASIAANFELWQRPHSIWPTTAEGGYQ